MTITLDNGHEVQVDLGTDGDYQPTVMRDLVDKANAALGYAANLAANQPVLADDTDLAE
jgi:hypothetical protein